MTISDDIKKGREIYRKRNNRTTQTRKSNGSNRLAIGIGTIIEQLTPICKLFKKAPSKIGPAMEPYKEIVKLDLKTLLDKISDKFPKKPVKYDPLYESWKRSRNQ